MLCDVYPLRLKGQKLPLEEVRARVRRGHIALARRTDGAPVTLAKLISPRGGVLGELKCAAVAKITDEGLMVTGFELHTQHRQAWWCVPVMGAPAE